MKKKISIYKHLGLFGKTLYAHKLFNGCNNNNIIAVVQYITFFFSIIKWPLASSTGDIVCPVPLNPYIMIFLNKTFLYKCFPIKGYTIFMSNESYTIRRIVYTNPADWESLVQIYRCGCRARYYNDVDETLDIHIVHIHDSIIIINY